MLSSFDRERHLNLKINQLYTTLAQVDLVIYDDRGFSFERNCVLCRWESETLK